MNLTIEEAIYRGYTYASNECGDKIVKLESMDWLDIVYYPYIVSKEGGDITDEMMLKIS